MNITRGQKWVNRILGTFSRTTPYVPTILCADDDDNVRALCAAAVRRAGFAADEAADGRQALDKIKTNHYEGVFLDLSMPHLHGATVLSVIERNDPDLLKRLIVLTGAPEAALVDITPRVRAVARKPFSLEALTYLLTKLREETAAS